jgi:hypothetical protein
MQCPLCSEIMLPCFSSNPDKFLYNVCKNKWHNITHVYIKCDYVTQQLKLERPIHLEIKKMLSNFLIENPNGEYIQYYVDHKNGHAYSIKEMEKVSKLRVFW